MTPPTRVLALGPLPQAGAPIGGASLRFAETCRQLTAQPSLHTRVVSTGRAWTHSGRSRLQRCPDELRAWARVIGQAMESGPRPDVLLFNLSPTSALRAGPAIWASTRALGVPLVVHLFNGSLDQDWQAAPAWQRRAAQATWLRHSTVLLETQALCRAFGDRVGHMPNTRTAPAQVATRIGPCRRFLFLSQLRPEKGLAEAVAALEHTPADCSLDIYGVPLPNTDLSFLDQAPRARFHGTADPADVPALLARHDALVLPTRHRGEGMPGVVIEALQHGLPVISTRWRAVPEVVTHGRSGLLVAPGNVPALAAAMHRLATETPLFHRLQQGARARGLHFDSAPWHQHLAQVLRHAAGHSTAPTPPIQSAA